MDDRLAHVVPGFNGLTEEEREDYRDAYSILLMGSATNSGIKGPATNGQSRNSGMQSLRGDRGVLNGIIGGGSKGGVQQILVDTLADDGMRSAVRGTLLQEPGSLTQAILYSAVSFVLLAGVLSFVLWFVLAFGLTRGREVISSFMITFWASQAITFLVTQPAVLLLGLVWAMTCGPTVNRWFSWVPCCGASDEATTFSGSRVLSGRVENVAMLHAVGATAGLAARDSLLVFSLTSALTAALASDFVSPGQFEGTTRRRHRRGSTSSIAGTPRGRRGSTTGMRGLSNSDSDNESSTVDGEDILVVQAAEIEGRRKGESSADAAKRQRKAREKR